MWSADAIHTISPIRVQLDALGAQIAKLEEDLLNSRLFNAAMWAGPKIMANHLLAYGEGDPGSSWCLDPDTEPVEGLETADLSFFVSQVDGLISNFRRTPDT